MLCEIREISKRVRDLLATGAFNHLRRKMWRDYENPWAGHCYTACEVVYYLAGGRKSGLLPHHISNDDGSTHWYLALEDEVIDPTVEQFDSTPNYAIGVSLRFLTRRPSRRAHRLREALESHVSVV